MSNSRSGPAARRVRAALVFATIVGAAGACSRGAPLAGDTTAAADRAHSGVAASGGAGSPRAVAFQPPPDSTIPSGEFGDVVRRGRAIFIHTGDSAKAYVGNSLRCENCHLDAGRLANSAPMWAAWVAYPKYRSKNKQVNTMADRIAGCFRYSMNGTSPAPDSDIMRALQSYFYWLATGAPTGGKLAGAGYPTLPKAAQPPDSVRGAVVYGAKCALCHGSDGGGQRSADGVITFPPVWGPQSYNAGAGMHTVSTAAAFIRRNMPLGRPNTLSEQDAWDVAAYVNAQPRPPDPRAGGIAP